MTQTWSAEELEDGQEYSRVLCDMFERRLADELSRVRKRAPKTLFTHLHAFNAHCRETIGLRDSLYATPEIVARYLAELMVDGKSKRYVREARDSIAYAFDRVGAPLPTAHSLVRAVMLRNDETKRSRRPATTETH